MEKQRTMLGARVLSEQELEMILPNAGSVLEQIEVFRKNITGMAAEQGQELEQKTNNIGIIGRRGAGKTSVLKTFKEMLREKNIESGKNSGRGKDILLPLIVPENMSSGTTLMDVVLGMLKSKVEEYKKETERERGDCIYSGRNSLEKEYNELVKQYCYIKKDYRDILIQQFTTEQNYVDKTKEVFNSDTEFISLFRQFVEHLLEGNNRESGKNNNALLFLFIDDIDLSTTRCMDVVRTLLSYLSLPRIVTFISGDMETFEEALTLDFLRQENALDAGVFGKTYCSATKEGGRALLERKKVLAYEYLKKIIPPAYRKRIKYWSLEERGAYQITEDGENNQRNLAGLLMELTKDKIDKGYFSYEENGKVKYMSPVFHMFDDISRSLNNVYNVLQELCEQNEEELLSSRGEVDTDEATKLKKMSGNWRLIETLVDSKQLYSEYKDQLLKKIIILEQNQVRIDFESADRFLYVTEDDQQKSVKEKESAGKNEAEKGESGKVTGKFIAEEKFAIFILLDFAIQLFGLKERGKEAYVNLKNKIVAEYLSDEAIDGKIARSRDVLRLKEKMEAKASLNQLDSVVKIVLYNLLYYGDFIFDLYIIKYLGRDEVYRILGKTSWGWDASEQADIYKVAYALARTLDAICGSTEKRRDYLADLYNRNPQSMLILLNNISSDRWIIFAEQLVPIYSVPSSKRFFNSKSLRDEQYSWDMANKNFENIDNYINESKSMWNTQNYLWAEHENKIFLYWIFYEELKEGRGIVFDLKEKARDLLHVGLKSTIIRRLNRTAINNQYEIKELKKIGYVFDSAVDTAHEKRKKQYQAIMLIDDNGLWEDEYAKANVRKYLEDEIGRYVEKIQNDSLIFDASNLVKNSYKQLKDCDKGSSGRALIYELWDRINRVMKLEFENLEEGNMERNKTEDYYIFMDSVLVLQCLLEDFLNRHYRIRYGKKEARQFLAELRELPMVICPTGVQAVAVEKMRTETTKGLKKLNEQFHEKMINLLGNEETLEGVIKESWEKFYKDGKGRTDTLGHIIAEIFRTKGSICNATSCYYVMYLVQREQIKKIKEKYLDSKQPKTSTGDIGISVSEQEYDFIFHSYLRYLQANESEAAKAGAEATVVAALATDLLESEGIADNRMISNIYEKVGRQLDLTEDEFGELFTGK